jgi:hypothetical protein
MRFGSTSDAGATGRPELARDPGLDVVRLTSPRDVERWLEHQTPA